MAHREVVQIPPVSLASLWMFKSLVALNKRWTQPTRQVFLLCDYMQEDEIEADYDE